ncbi:MAG: CsgG/HfaB family protein [Spirochaetota bacterium]
MKLNLFFKLCTIIYRMRKSRLRKVQYSALFLIFLASASVAYADRNERAAILDFKAYNCSASLARVATDFISTKIFEAKIFTIVEREQIDKVLKEIELQKTKYTESESAVKMGKLLSARKILAGSVHRLDKYYLIMKVINVEDGTVEGDYRVSFNNESAIEDAVSELVNIMLYDFKNEIFYSYSFSAGFLYRSGDFEKIADYGYGINLGFNIHNLLFNKTVASVSTGLHSFKGKYKSIDSLITIPLLIYAGYTYRLSDKIRMVPSIGGGYLISMMNYDKNGADAYGNYSYSKEYYFDPAVSVKCDIDYLLFSDIHISLSPSYTIFFEKNHTPQIAGLNLGVRMLF